MSLLVVLSSIVALKVHMSKVREYESTRADQPPSCYMHVMSYYIDVYEGMSYFGTRSDVSVT